MTSSYAITDPTNLHDNGYTTGQTNYLDCSPFSRWRFTTSATKIFLKAWDTIQGVFPGWAHIAIWINGSPNQTLVSTGVNYNEFTATLPSGHKTVDIVTSLQSKQAETLRGTFLKSIYFSGAGDTVMVSPSAPTILAYGDSIVVGANSDYPITYGWTNVLRRYGYRVMVEGWGYRTLYTDCVDVDARTAFSARVASYSPATIWLAMGTNDYGLQKWSSADFGTAYADLLDKLHADLPSAEIYAQTPLLRSSEAELTEGYGTLGDYRTAIATAVSTRSEWCTLVDGTAIVELTDLDDGTHPTNAGHTIYADYVAGIL